LSGNNISDAAAYHTLSRRREIMKADNTWVEDKHKKMFERLEQGNPTAKDLQEVLQPMKPFLNALIPFEDKSDGTAGFSHLAPVQFKNAEILLLPSLAFLTTSGVATIINKLRELENRKIKGDLIMLGKEFKELLDNGLRPTIEITEDCDIDLDISQLTQSEHLPHFLKYAGRYCTFHQSYRH
jgi:hypothetical protein